eukprot:Gb_32565 [translate_table: standard]
MILIKLESSTAVDDWLSVAWIECSQGRGRGRGRAGGEGGAELGASGRERGRGCAGGTWEGGRAVGQRVVCDNGKSERIIIDDDSRTNLAQDAVTDYRVLGPSVDCSLSFVMVVQGLLLRQNEVVILIFICFVYTAEALGTPIVGDYKYGWSAHRSSRQMPRVDIDSQEINSSQCCQGTRAIR